MTEGSVTKKQHQDEDKIIDKKHIGKGVVETSRALSLDIPPDYEKRVNRAFAFILKNSKKFYMAQTQYNIMTEKDLTRSGTVDDFRRKIFTIDGFHSITKMNLLTDRFQNKFMWDQVKTTIRA
jgi:hypothetical protein